MIEIINMQSEMYICVLLIIICKLLVLVSLFHFH